MRGVGWGGWVGRGLLIDWVEELRLKIELWFVVGWRSVGRRGSISLRLFLRVHDRVGYHCYFFFFFFSICSQESLSRSEEENRARLLDACIAPTEREKIMMRPCSFLCFRIIFIVYIIYTYK
jgi:hypothetical protein